MEFSALAAKETSALLTRALDAASKASLERVEALRATVDAASKALEAAIAAPPDVELDLDELVKRLGKAAAADADVRLKHLSAEARKITDALRAELGDAIGEKDALAISLKDSRAQLDSLRAQLATEQKQAQAIQKELAEAHLSSKKLETGKADAAAARDKEAAARPWRRANCKRSARSSTPRARMRSGRRPCGPCTRCARRPVPRAGRRLHHRGHRRRGPLNTGRTP